MTCVTDQVNKLLDPNNTMSYDEKVEFVESLLNRQAMINQLINSIKRRGPIMRVDVIVDEHILFKGQLNLVEVNKLKKLIDWMSRR